MPVISEDPTQLSKSRLKSDLIAHSVALPPSKSKKQVYVELHLKHINRQKAADFSSDEEDQAQDEEEEEEVPDNTEILDPSTLTDEDLKAALLKHGIKAGPIVASTRAIYEKKLRKLLQTHTQDGINGAEEGAVYSDSEEEAENEEEEEDEESGSEEAREDAVAQLEDISQVRKLSELLVLHRGGHAYHQCFLLSSRLRACPTKRWEPSPKRNARNVLESSEQGRSCCSQIPAGLGASSVVQHSGLGSGVPSGSVASVMSNISSSSSSSKTFSITQMVEEGSESFKFWLTLHIFKNHPSRNVFVFRNCRWNTHRVISQQQVESRRSLTPSADSDKVLNGSNVEEHWSRSNRVSSCTMRNQSLYYTPEAPLYKRGMKVPQESTTDIFREMFPNAETTPTGIYVSRRRPIKGAAGRPVQYKYPESPVSPTTLERREVERCLVPIHVQIAVFFIVAGLLYLIYDCVEENSYSPFVALLDSLIQGSDSEEGLLIQSETEVAPALSGQE
ncbi:LEM domain-containing protein 1 [Genypterus blacodes]|uniref:LEM domain-containing protein 1 n=1 Tax=Genypterus blacodes TaxID=154954 RepID=UPI003F75E321